MKIALVTPLPLETHGVAYYSHHLLESFLEQGEGWEFLVFATSRTRPHHDPKLKVFPVLETNGDYSARVAREIIESRPNLVHIQHDYEIFGDDARFIDLIESLKTEGIPVILTLHNVEEDQGTGKSKGRFNYQYEIASLADLVIVHHTYPSRRALIKAGLPRRKIKVIRHGTWNYDPDEKIAARRFLGLPEEGIIVGVISTFGPMGDKSFIEAIPYLKEYKERVVFWVAGNSERYGFDADALEKEVFLRKFLNNVIVSDLTVPIHWIKEVFAAPDIILVNMKGEREGTHTIHYALPAKRPILISSESKAKEEVFLFLSKNLLYSPKDPEGLAKRITELSENQLERAFIEKREEEYARKTDWKDIARLHLLLYRRLLKEREYTSLTFVD
jgi:glycosyltransferase involved in cell wall biosynthesis